MNSKALLSAMTKKQRKRLSEMLSQDLLAPTAYSLSLPRLPKAAPRSPDELMARLENARAERERLTDDNLFAAVDRILSREQLFRFAYVPFVVARLVWDYADTIHDICIQMRLQETKKLSRTMRQLKTDYDRLRQPYINMEHKGSEERNMIVFEDAIAEYSQLYFINLKGQVQMEYPELREEYRSLIFAVYQCRAMLRALTAYEHKQRTKISERLGRELNCILPPQLKALGQIVIEFAGDKRLSSQWDAKEEQFIDTFAAQISRIKLVNSPQLTHPN